MSFQWKTDNFQLYFIIESIILYDEKKVVLNSILVQKTYCFVLYHIKSYVEQQIKKIYFKQVKYHILS